METNLFQLNRLLNTNLRWAKADKVDVDYSDQEGQPELENDTEQVHLSYPFRFYDLYKALY